MTDRLHITPDDGPPQPGGIRPGPGTGHTTAPDQEPRARVRIPSDQEPAGSSSPHDLAMQIRYDLTAAQGKLTELLRQIAALPNQGKIETAHDRAIARAQQRIQAGEWDHLQPHQLDVELDDLGIAHADRWPLERQHALRPSTAVTGADAKGAPSDG